MTGGKDPVVEMARGYLDRIRDAIGDRWEKVYDNPIANVRASDLYRLQLLMTDNEYKTSMRFRRRHLNRGATKRSAQRRNNVMRFLAVAALYHKQKSDRLEKELARDVDTVESIVFYSTKIKR